MFRVIKIMTTTTLVMVGCMAFLGCNAQTVVDPGGDTTTLAVFTDEATGFETSDVYDVDDDIVQFDTTAMSIIWKEDGRVFQEGVWDIDGNLLRGGFFHVLFGNAEGERRAYFTETATETICDIEPAGDSVIITPTDQVVPQ